MSTAGQATGGAAAEPKTVDPSLLDAAVAATQHRESLKQQAAAYLQCHPDKVYDLLRHKWKTKKDDDAFTDGELFLGLCMIVKYDLDPMAKEIYLGRAKDGSLMIIIAIDGWIKIVHRSGDYNGHTQEVHFDDGGDMDWVETTIYSKTRDHPTVYRGYAVEYMRLGGFMKSSIPWHMLKLFSFRHAARFFAPVGGAVVTQEEARWMERGEPADPAQAPADSLEDLTAQLNAKPEPADEPPEAPPESPESKPRAKRSPNKPKEAEPVEDPPEVDLVHESKLHRDRLWQALSKAKSPAYVEAIRKEANDLWGSGDLHDEDCQAVMKSCEETKAALEKRA